MILLTDAKVLIDTFAQSTWLRASSGVAEDASPEVAQLITRKGTHPEWLRLVRNAPGTVVGDCQHLGIERLHVHGDFESMSSAT
jgi:hypothetical protein